MSGIVLYGLPYCGPDGLAEELVFRTGFPAVSDRDLAERAGGICGLSAGDVLAWARAIETRQGPLNSRDRLAAAGLKLALARSMAQGGILLNGRFGLLVPPSASPFLRVGLTAGMAHRLSVAKSAMAAGEAAVRSALEEEDRSHRLFFRGLEGAPTDGEPAGFDLVIRMDAPGVEGAASTVLRELDKPGSRAAEVPRQALEDWFLAARVETALIREGHDLRVRAENGRVTLTLARPVVLLNRLERELRSLAGQVDGAAEVIVETGSGGSRDGSGDPPHKILLVDDEADFVQTLSERLLLREFGSEVAHSGQDGLKMVEADPPDVIVLDLRMPGIDGMEMLRRVKSKTPEIEVIVLTGQGSEAEKTRCLEMGAFAYLRKPADMNALSEAIRGAQARILRRRQSGKANTGL